MGDPENKSFYKKILAEENYLAFSSEIDYLTGLQRKNKDLVTLLSQRVQSALDRFTTQIGFDIRLTYFDDIELGRDLLDSLSRENILESLEESEDKDTELGATSILDENDEKTKTTHRDNRPHEEHLESPSTENRATLIERIRKSRLDAKEKGELRKAENKMIDRLLEPDSQDVVRDVYESYETLLIENLGLFASVIRNCDLISDKEFKKEKLKACVESFLKLLYGLMLEQESSIEDLEEEEIQDFLSSIGEDSFIDFDMSPDTYKREAKVAFKIFLFLVIQSVMHSLLSTRKLELPLAESIKSTRDSAALRLMCVLLYNDLQLPGYIDKVETILKVEEIKESAYYNQVLYVNLHSLYSTKNLGRRERRRIEDILADIVLAHSHQYISVLSNKTGGTLIKGYNRSKAKAIVIDQIRKKSKNIPAHDQEITGRL
jgi:hypothetical protein